MMQKLIHLLWGEVSFLCSSDFPERILNLCAANRIPFREVEWLSSRELRFTVSRRDSRELQRLAEKLPGRLEVTGKRGLPFLARRLSRRRVLLITGALCALLLFAGSFFVWDFRVEGNEAVTEEAILRALAEEGVELGSFGFSINSTRLRNRILLRLPQLSYIAVNVRGCVAHVQVRERVPKPEIVSQRQPTNVVAAKNGLVTRVEALDGYAAVKPGMTVLEGQLLISGVADSGRSGLRLLHGMGKVYARTWYDRTVRIPLQKQVRVYTGENRSRLAVEWGRKRINLYGNSSITPMDCDKIIRTQKLSLLGIALPLTLVWEQCRPYCTESVAVSLEEARQRGEELLLSQLEKELGEQGRITSTRFAADVRDGALLVTMTAECLEQIGEQVPIETEEAS